MSLTQDREIAQLVDLDTGLIWLLRHRHYPPIPLNMLEPCKKAIEEVNNGNPYADVELPVNVTYKGEHAAPAFEIVRQHHLDAWIEDDDL